MLKVTNYGRYFTVFSNIRISGARDVSWRSENRDRGTAAYLMRGITVENSGFRKGRFKNATGLQFRGAHLVDIEGYHGEGNYGPDLAASGLYLETDDEWKERCDGIAGSWLGGERADEMMCSLPILDGENIKHWKDRCVSSHGIVRGEVCKVKRRAKFFTIADVSMANALWSALPKDLGDDPPPPRVEYFGQNTRITIKRTNLGSGTVIKGPLEFSAGSHLNLIDVSYVPTPNKLPRYRINVWPQRNYSCALPDACVQGIPTCTPKGVGDCPTHRGEIRWRDEPNPGAPLGVIGVFRETGEVQPGKPRGWYWVPLAVWD